MTFSLDYVLTPEGENCCWSLLGLTGLIKKYGICSPTFGCLPFTKHFRKIHLESKWHTMLQQKLSRSKGRAVIKSRGPGISPGYYEYGPRLLLMENKGKLEPKETPRCLIPCLLAVFTQQLEILTTTLKGTSQKVALFFWTECPKRKFVFHFFKANFDTSFRPSRPSSRKWN